MDCPNCSDYDDRMELEPVTRPHDNRNYECPRCGYSEER